MHPIERLRYVAHATGADPVTLVGETAKALRDLQIEPAGLVLACRRIIEHHPTVGPLWWLCARLISSFEPFELAGQLATEIAHDPSPAHLADSLSADSTLCIVGWSPLAIQAAVLRGDCRVLVVDSHGEGRATVNVLERAHVPVEYVALESAAGAIMSADVVIIEALACGPAEILCAGGSHGVVGIADCSSRLVWLVAGLGTRLPEVMWSTMNERIQDGHQAWEIGTDVIPIDLFATVIGPTGVSAASPDSLVAECASMPELLRQSAM